MITCTCTADVPDGHKQLEPLVFLQIYQISPSGPSHSCKDSNQKLQSHDWEEDCTVKNRKMYITLYKQYMYIYTLYMYICNINTHVHVGTCTCNIN